MNCSCPALLSLCLMLGVAGCDTSGDRTFQGYVEGEFVYLASSRAGRLDTLMVERGNTVDAGVLLYELESESERQSLRQAEQEWLSATAQLADMETGKRPEEIAMAEAQLSQARGEAENAVILLRRHENLIKSDGISRQELDDSRAKARTSAARVAELASQVEVWRLPERQKKREAQQAVVEAAGARLSQARWELEQKKIQSPAAGLIYDTLFRRGEWVPAGNPVVQMLPPGNVKIRFFIPETFADAVHPGSQVAVQVDGRPGPFPARISYVSPNAEYTPPVIYSNETRSKLIFMAEARPEPSVAASLHPGQPVRVCLP